MRPSGRTSYRRIRQIAQIVALFLFFWLFRRTDFTGSDTITHAVNIIFRIDPLVAVSTILASKEWIALLWPALVTVMLTILLGRFFCGWLCPLGTLLDVFHWIFKIRPVSRGSKLASIKYAILIFILLSAALGISFVGLLDPFSILVRGLTTSVDPAMYASVTQVSAWVYKNAPGWIVRISESVYSLVRDTILPFHHKVYSGAVLSFLLLGLIFSLEMLSRRFWCRNICPLGAMLSLLSRWNLVRLKGGSECGSCRTCGSVCRMGAIDDHRGISPHACIVCLDCVDVCPAQKIRPFPFSEHRPVRSYSPEGLSRRAFLSLSGAGILIPLVVRSTRLPDPTGMLTGQALLRPPGSFDEEEFLARCVRCGECMKVCIGNALHPSFLENGLQALFAPRLIPRIGYCEYNCTLCGQVCPTGAIRKLTSEEKKTWVIGTAYIDKNRCLPYARNISCIVCEEHCPTGDKAIKFDEAEVEDSDGVTRTIRRPYVVDDLCIGCGICETRCPLVGQSAILVTADRETRHPDYSY